MEELYTTKEKDMVLTFYKMGIPFIYKHCAYTWYLLFTINDEEEDEDDDGVHAA